METLCTVRPNKSLGQKIISVTLIALTIICLILFLITFNSIILGGGIAFGSIWYFLVKDRVVDIDYQFIPGELSFVKIINMNRRKVMLTLNMEEVSVIGRADSQAVLGFTGNSNFSKKDFTTKREEGTIYVVCANTQKGGVCIYFEPDMELLDAMQKYYPRIVTR